MWSTYLFDVLSGRLIAPIDIPNASWSMTVSNASLSTTKDKGTGEDDISGLTVPWSAVPGETRETKNEMLAEYRRGLCLMWDNKPVVAGIIYDREDTALDVSFSVMSVLDFLERRIVIQEGTFGMVGSGTTSSVLSFKNKSLRGIAAGIGQHCTSKPGGYLPIDWQYVDEKGSHERTYSGYNVSNNNFKHLVENITNAQGGCDIQFRPVIENNNLHWLFVAGSDTEPYLEQLDIVPTLAWSSYGGTIENIKVTHAAPVMRVYSTGAGQDEAKLCAMAEDLTLCKIQDSYPIIETDKSFSSIEEWWSLYHCAERLLSATKYPLMQIRGTVYANDHIIVPGEFWTGQSVDVDIQGFPSLPDGIYEMRVMEMSGDLTDKIDLIFDVILNPWEYKS